MQGRRGSNSETGIVTDPATGVIHIKIDDRYDYIASLARKEKQKAKAKQEVKVNLDPEQSRSDFSNSLSEGHLSSVELSRKDSENITDHPLAKVSSTSDVCAQAPQQQNEEAMEIEAVQLPLSQPLTPPSEPVPVPLAQPAPTPMSQFQTIAIPADIQQKEPVRELKPEQHIIIVNLKEDEDEPLTPKKMNSFWDCCGFSACCQMFFSARPAKKEERDIELKSMSNKPAEPDSPASSQGLRARNRA